MLHGARKREHGILIWTLVQGDRVMGFWRFAPSRLSALVMLLVVCMVYGFSLITGHGIGWD